MANTLTNLIPTLYEAVDVVSRELAGLIPASLVDASANRAAVGQSVRSFVAPAAAAEDITAATTPPDTGDQTIGSQVISITKARAVPFRWTGEEELSVNNNGPGWALIQRDQIAQAIRTLVNEIETDLAALHLSASRGYGAAATAPFNNTLGDAAQMLKILKDNGAPDSDLQLVLNTTAGAALRSVAQLTKVNEAGTSSLRNQGTLIDLFGFQVRESAKIKSHTAGTAANATTTAAGFAVGATTIALASAGTGTILAGDIISFAGDANKYVVVTGDADVSNGGSIVIAAPGLMQAIPASATNITVTATHTRNMAFHRNAIQLALRAPALPSGGDSAADRQIVTDPRTGIAFEFSMYPQYRRMRYEVGIAWGVAAMKTEHMGILIA